MQSEFNNVALDRIRYSLVWESAGMLAAALDVQPTDHALVISSAGCNVLNTLLLGPGHLTAIDLNPVQNQLLRFKCYLIHHHAPAVLRALLGLDGPAAVQATWQTLEPRLPINLRAYWGSFFESHPAGLLTAGRLESYVTGFLATLPAEQQHHLRQVLHQESVAQQHRYFLAHLHGTTFQQQFLTYFNDANLSCGRDPQLFRHATQAGGEAFYIRLCHQLSTELVRDNFFFRFFFFGPENLPEAVLPPCYQQQNFWQLRARLGRLTLTTGEATDYLLSEAGRHITKASLSNIFEYVSAAEFERVSEALFANSRPLRVVFWNLLQAQAASGTSTAPLAACLSEQVFGRPGGCFYFHSARVLDARLQADEYYRHPHMLPMVAHL
jgi:S-adenosylmethionine-diacylglycerol 3-amino-3-carboxypropyl transferase